MNYFVYFRTILDYCIKNQFLKVYFVASFINDECLQWLKSFILFFCFLLFLVIYLSKKSRFCVFHYVYKSPLDLIAITLQNIKHLRRGNYKKLFSVFLLCWYLSMKYLFKIASKIKIFLLENFFCCAVLWIILRSSVGLKFFCIKFNFFYLLTSQMSFRKNYYMVFIAQIWETKLFYFFLLVVLISCTVIL